MPSISLIWNGIEHESVEYLQLDTHQSDLVQATSSVITTFNRMPALVTYTISTDFAWNTRSAVIQVQTARGTNQMRIDHHEDGWTINGQQIARFSHCADIDLAITPFSNSLPIRRLNLAIGETASVDAVWVQFPDLAVDILTQQYTRTSELGWLYESGDFQADLKVDADGMVETYSGLFQRTGYHRLD